MALWPNNRRDFLGYQPVRTANGIVISQHIAPTQRRISVFGTLAQKSSWAEGGAPYQSIFLPIKAGGVRGASESSFSASASLLQGGPVQGTATITFATSGGASLITSMEGTASFSFVDDTSNLALTVGVEGSASFTFTGETSELAIIYPMDGTASFSFDASADLRGKLTMAGEFTPYTELSPQSLSAAVWNSAAAGYDTPGTMGEKLNDAGSASNPWAAPEGIQVVDELKDLWQFKGLDATKPAALIGDGDTSQVVTVDGKTLTITQTSMTRT